MFAKTSRICPSDGVCRQAGLSSTRSVARAIRLRPGHGLLGCREAEANGSYALSSLTPVEGAYPPAYNLGRRPH